MEVGLLFVAQYNCTLVVENDHVLNNISNSKKEKKKKKYLSCWGVTVSGGYGMYLFTEVK